MRYRNKTLDTLEQEKTSLQECIQTQKQEIAALTIAKEQGEKLQRQLEDVQARLENWSGTCKTPSSKMTCWAKTGMNYSKTTPN
ncbi:MAG: hypothetical protein HZT40_20645 [Candidatus Thiothrix singaporensis]|uniref:Uncharacterized protein n=1 Tax=Candidatus Thiothrix singaporensis TaxID=2799669 RepID=A0A7L6AWU5_9GAMM|nr:MAG: hypothetical protein HZT40_20645 [Candidatus Thiothrix singaporensis]